MAMWIHLLFLAFVLVFTTINGQSAYTGGCGLALEDVPNPASDSCIAFFRCYNYRQYSVRCSLGQAFDFDRARCRPAEEVDCPLQLQRFQAPAVPSYLRPPQYQAQQDREVEIRVVHVGAGTNPNNIQFYNNGRQIPASTQANAQGQTILNNRGGAPQTVDQGNGQVTQLTTTNGQTVPSQGQFFPLGGQVQGQGQGQGLVQGQGQAQGQASVPLFVSNPNNSL